MDLFDFFETHRKVALALSGGANSAYLLFAAIARGANVKPYFIKTPNQAESELQDALRLTEMFGLQLEIIELDSTTKYGSYKELLDHAVTSHATVAGYNVVIDGFCVEVDACNADTTNTHSIISPLQLCGLTTEETRRRSKSVNLFTWDKPSYDCLCNYVG